MYKTTIRCVKCFVILFSIFAIGIMITHMKIVIPISIFLCPKRRFLDLMEPDANTYYSLFLDDRSLEESHHLVRLDWSKIEIDEKADMFCGACELKNSHCHRF